MRPPHHALFHRPVPSDTACLVTVPIGECSWLCHILQLSRGQSEVNAYLIKESGEGRVGSVQWSSWEFIRSFPCSGDTTCTYLVRTIGQRCNLEHCWGGCLSRARGGQHQHFISDRIPAGIVCPQAFARGASRSYTGHRQRSQSTVNFGKIQPYGMRGELTTMLRNPPRPR